MDIHDGLPFISVVVPVYNEEQILPKFIATMSAELKKVSEAFEIVFAADPCQDRTLEIIREGATRPMLPASQLLALAAAVSVAAYAPRCRASRTRGQVVVVIDCDMQDPPALIPDMVKMWREGYKVVIPQRRSRTGEHPLKKLIAYSGYWFINKIANVKIPRNTGDFRLLDRRVVDELVNLNESHGFLRGLVAVVGFKTYLLPFDRDARKTRQRGKSLTTASPAALALNGFNGIVAFSDYLLSLTSMAGFCITAIAMLLIVVILVMKLVLQWPFESGVPSIMILVLLMGGLQMMSMGVLGAYVGRIYDEAKRRPKFIVEESVGLKGEFRKRRASDNP